MIFQKCLYTFLVLLLISSVALGEPGRKDIAKRDKNSEGVVDNKMKSRLNQKSKSGKGKRRSKRKLRKQSQQTAKNQKNKDGRRKIHNGGKDKKTNRMGKRKGRRRIKKMEKMISRCQNVTCLNDMLKVLKIKKDTVRNFMKQEKRLMGR